VTALSDVNLLEAHRQRQGGDDRAFAELVRRNVGWVHGSARRRLRDSNLADDVAQAVFILLHRKDPRFATDRALVAWLHRTTWYASEVAAREQRRRRRHETEAAVLRQQVTDATEPDWQWEQLAPLLEQLIEKRARRDREAVLLRFCRQMRFAQVAVAMESTEEASRKRVARALEKLRHWSSVKGVDIGSAEALAAGLESEVGGAASAAPVGLIAAATGAALAGHGSAVTASTIPIAKGAITMMAWAKAKLVAGVALAVLIPIAGGVALIAATATSSSAPRQLAAPASQPQPDRPTYDRLSPYDAIRWKDDNTPEIHVAGTWYGWLALDDTDVAKIIEFTRKTYRPREVRMRIGEDLVEVLTRMGNPPGPTVKLKVRKLDTGEAIDLNDVPMTHENRQKVFKARLDSERAR